MSRITAVLGPTNTGKTHYAVERMLSHRTGVIGLPLRLLAREVYERIVAARGPSVVALVTGEERIVPPRAVYWVATTEAMPEVAADFVAIDEVQMCADPQRGHVFTDRLLNMRGLHETLFLGADTMRPAIAALIPGVQFMRRERFSSLTWAGGRKLARMPARSAVVGFSLDDVYATAELIRRQKGGCAVVMGALSPRTRNAQVAMYQAGEVDYLVATDAIGMGLNLDIRHVAFSATHKFDGRRVRPLFPHELGQIAGRAGRHTEAGTFGVTGEAETLDEGLIAAIEGHRFAPIARLMWRNRRLDFGTPARLLEALQTSPDSEWLVRGREADDVAALKTLLGMPEIADKVSGPADLRLLWDVCRVPDFRGISPMEHATLLSRVFGFLHEGKPIPFDWLTGQIERLDRTHGDIDALSKRLAYIRTWTYCAQRSGWLSDENHWREATRAVEDRLSDALHAALTQRFVDRRTSVLMRRLKQKDRLVADVNENGEVMVEGEFAGRLEGFRFRADPTATAGDETKMLNRAAYEALRPEFHLRADRFYNAPDTELDFTEQGGLMWGDQAVGKLVKGADALKPSVEPFVDEEAGSDVQEKVARRLQHFIDRKIAAGFEPLIAMSRDEALEGIARGFAFRLVESLGLVARTDVATEVKDLDQPARGALRKHGVRFGQFTVFMPALLKPAPTRLRLVLSSLWRGLDEFPESPPPGLVTIPNDRATPRETYLLSGYRTAGTRAIRVDMLERLADMLRTQDSRAGFEANPDMLSITGLTLEQFADLMQGLGYHAERGERAKVRPQPKPAHAPEEPTSAVEAPETVGPTSAVEAPEGEPTSAVEAPVADMDDKAAESSVETPVVDPAAPESHVTVTQAPESALVAETQAPAENAPEAQSEASAESDAPHATVVDAIAAETGKPAAEVESEVFYQFTWVPRPRGGNRPNRDAATPEGGSKPEVKEGDRRERAPRSDRGPAPQGGKPRGKGPRGGKPARDGGGAKAAPRYEARPPKNDKPIDPDNPFAVLAQLKDK